MVENGIEGYFRGQVSCLAFIWWPGISETVLALELDEDNEHITHLCFFYLKNDQ